VLRHIALTFGARSRAAVARKKISDPLLPVDREDRGDLGGVSH
jgi:hypothetical protein